MLLCEHFLHILYNLNNNSYNVAITGVAVHTKKSGHSLLYKNVHKYWCAILTKIINISDGLYYR